MEKEIKRLLRGFKRTELSEQDVTDAILKLIESSKVVLPQADVNSMYCGCHLSQCYLMNGSYICVTCNRPLGK